MSILDVFRSHPQPEGDDDERGPRHVRHVMRCMTKGCDRPALAPDTFCAVCAGRRMTLMVFFDDDLEDWPTRATQEPITNGTLPALPALTPTLNALPAALNAAGDPPLAPSAWEAPGRGQEKAQDEAASCRWCVWEMSEWRCGAAVGQWMASHPGPWRICQTHAQRWPQFQRGLGRQ